MEKPKIAHKEKSIIYALLCLVGLAIMFWRHPLETFGFVLYWNASRLSGEYWEKHEDETKE